ncbi:MAG: hypothetical protein OEV44_15410, partial [Spirochaetota bacterium]|nr:hypothetical protein [Spirochaetota bacterium]
HHMIDPRKGFESLLQHVKPSGYISAWVYGRENNGWIVAIVNPIRKYVTSKLPLPVSKFISYLVCMFLYPILKLIYKPINTKLKFLSKLLCYNSYLFYISKFSFKEIHSIIFDHLLAPIAFYIRRNDFLSWFEDNDLVDINIGWHNENSWRGFGKKK